jgi:AcrR family transcriptional regulator
VPKVSEHHREQRRQQILDGARSCFARHGYERATVRELEAAIGLSSGAIFSYYPSKLDLFIALAAEDAATSARLWREGGLPGVILGMRAKSAELSASYLELGRRIWSDEEFRDKWFERGQPLMATIEDSITAAVAAGEVRDDIPVDVLVEFATVMLDGLMLGIRTGMVPDRLTSVLSMYDEVMRGPRGT